VYIKEKGCHFQYQKTDYTLHSFVYILPKVPDSPYQIGQVIKIEESKIRTSSSQNAVISYTVYLTVRILQRAIQIKKDKHTIKDNRHLVFTDVVKTVSHKDLEGACTVKPLSAIANLDAYKDRLDCFYVNDLKDGLNADYLKDLTSFKPPAKNIKREGMFEEFKKKAEPLVALDIFAGCGGLTCGMHKAGLVDTKYAIEFSSSATLSFR
jgi:DNA (cytosine-5)-methyltransferase 1